MGFWNYRVILKPPTMAVEGPTAVPLPPTSTPAPAPTLLPYLAVPEAYASIQAAIDAAQNGDLTGGSSVASP